MQAIVYDHYGPADVLKIETIEQPTIGDRDLLVEVHATSVTTADWRFRAAAFPRGMRLVGRLVVGLFRPRNRLTGREFSGRVVAVGANVSRFQPGDEVFGANPKGVNAERIVVPESGAVVHKPKGISHAEAAALPFGSIAALTFLRDMANVRPGERVLILGASGGVGVYAVQIAKHLGAHVAAVASTANLQLLRDLGADRVIDYTVEDPRDVEGTYDVIVDPIGKSRLRDYRDKMGPDGRHAFIEAGPREIWQSVATRWSSGPKALFGVSEDNREAFEAVRELVEAGALRPVIGHQFPMTDVVEAHRVVERRRRRGAVVLAWQAAQSHREGASPQAEG